MSAASSELLLSQDYGRGSLSARSRDGTGGRTNGQPVFWSRVCPRPIGSRFSTPGLQPQWNRKWQTSFPTGNFLTSNLFDLNSRVLYLHQETLLQQQQQKREGEKILLRKFSTSVFSNISPWPFKGWARILKVQITFVSICDYSDYSYHIKSVSIASYSSNYYILFDIKCKNFSIKQIMEMNF